MQNEHHVIDVILTLTSPMHVAFPDNQIKLKGEGGKKLSQTTKKPVIDKGRAEYVPFFPANGLRGGLRRKAASYVMGHLCEKESTISSSLYLGLSCGASSGSPDQTALSVEEILRAKRNVYMGLFGGGARLIASAYRVSDINPVIDLTVKTHMVPDYCRELVTARKTTGNEPEFLSSWELTKNGTMSPIRIDDVYLVKDGASIQRYMTNPVESVARHQELVGLNRAARTESEGTVKVVKEDVANMMAIETVATGTPMHFRITLAPDATEAQIGMMLYALTDLIRENSLGGMGRIDCGRFRVDTIKIQLGSSLANESIDIADCQEGAEFSLPDTAMITHLLEAADAGLSALTVAEMQSYYTDFSADKKAAKKAEGKAKAAAK